MTTDQQAKKWWNTLPGILSAFGATVTAITGLIIALNQAGIIGGIDEGINEKSKEVSRNPSNETITTPLPISTNQAGIIGSIGEGINEKSKEVSRNPSNETITTPLPLPISTPQKERPYMVLVDFSEGREGLRSSYEQDGIEIVPIREATKFKLRKIHGERGLRLKTPHQHEVRFQLKEVLGAKMDLDSLKVRSFRGKWILRSNIGHKEILDQEGLLELSEGFQGIKYFTIRAAKGQEEAAGIWISDVRIRVRD